MGSGNRKEKHDHEENHYHNRSVSDGIQYDGDGEVHKALSSSTATDGKISGVTATMEYQIDGATTWTAVGENQTEITGLTAGTYKVRYAGTSDKNASDATSVEVGVKATQTITASDVTVTYGDTGKSVSATATGGGAITYAVKEDNGNYITRRAGEYPVRLFCGAPGGACF